MFKNLVLFFVVGTACAQDLPPEFEKCKRSDPKFDECLSKAIEHSFSILDKPLPEFNFEGLDPIKIPSLTVGAGTGVVHVTQNYRNVEVHYLQNYKINGVKSTINDNEFKLLLDAFLDVGKLEGDYSLDGNILVFPITGNGTCTIALYNLKTTFDISGDIITKKEEKYVNVKDFKVKFVPDKVTLDFRNLFNGNEVLGREMNQLLNDNWKDVLDDVLHKYEDVLGPIFKDLANLIFNKVPFDKIFLP